MADADETSKWLQPRFNTRCTECVCAEDIGDSVGADYPASVTEVPLEPLEGWPEDKGLVAYNADINQPLIGAPFRVGEVWHLPTDEVWSFQKATLSLYANGFSIRTENGRPPFSIAWSPFSLTQACRLHSEQADLARPWMRLFKVSAFHHGITHLFAVEGEDASAERTRWVADIARALRIFTQTLFPPFRLAVNPVKGAVWTDTRLLAGYMLMCDSNGVCVVYAELHAHWDSQAAFVAYENELCDARVLHIPLTAHTSISERVGVDCSCFIIDAHHFSTRTCSEKVFWLRAISNVKVKIRHSTTNPTMPELHAYRKAISECAKDVQGVQITPGPGGFVQRAMLPRLNPNQSKTCNSGDSTPTHNSISTDPMGKPSGKPVAGSPSGPALPAARADILPPPMPTNTVELAPTLVQPNLKVPDLMPSQAPTFPGAVASNDADPPRHALYGPMVGTPKLPVPGSAAVEVVPLGVAWRNSTDPPPDAPPLLALPISESHPSSEANLPEPSPEPAPSLSAKPGQPPVPRENSSAQASQADGTPRRPRTNSNLRPQRDTATNATSPSARSATSPSGRSAGSHKSADATQAEQDQLTRSKATGSEMGDAKSESDAMAKFLIREAHMKPPDGSFALARSPPRVDPDFASAEVPQVPETRGQNRPSVRESLGSVRKGEKKDFMKRIAWCGNS